MKKLTQTLLLIAVIAIGISSCGKDDKTKTGTDVADDYVGIWNTKDTFFEDGSFTTYNNTINTSFSVTKNNANNVNISNMIGVPGTTIWSVSSSSLSYVSGATGSDEYFLSSLVGRKNETKIYYTVTGYRRGVATKQ